MLRKIRSRGPGAFLPLTRTAVSFASLIAKINKRKLKESKVNQTSCLFELINRARYRKVMPAFKHGNAVLIHWDMERVSNSLIALAYRFHLILLNNEVNNKYETRGNYRWARDRNVPPTPPPPYPKLTQAAIVFFSWQCFDLISIQTISSPLLVESIHRLF